MSYNLWRNTFASNPSVLGQAVLVKGEPYTIVGVLPDRALTPLNADLYTALQPSREGEGGGTNFQAITRLRDGATWQTANAEIDRAWSQRANRYELRNYPGAQVAYHSVPLQQGQTAKLRPQVLALMLSAGFILLTRLRQSGRSDIGSHVAAHVGSRDAARARSLALADPEAILDRKSAAGAGRRSGGNRDGLSGAARSVTALA